MSPAPSDPIIFYFDFISPFAHIGSVAIERLSERLDRKIVWRPVLVGITILKIMGMQPLPSIPLKGPYLRRDLERMSAYFDVPLRRHGLESVNSVAASRAFLKLSDEDEDLGKRFARRTFDRLWLEGKDITALSDVLEVAAEIGADIEMLQLHLARPEARDRLRAAVDEAVARGVFGVPTFAADGEIFWGNDHLWMLEHWLKRGGAPRA